MKLIRFADLTPKPWKNGGGTTTEIAVSPVGSGFDDFDWRLSVADVASDGPFSLFPNIDRTLTLIEGKGLVMAIDGREPTTLTPVSAPLSFPGDVPVTATLIHGPIRDFNVMTRRGRFSHVVTRHDLAEGPLDLPASGHHLALCLAHDTLEFESERLLVERGDLIDLEETKTTRIAGMTPILVLQIQPV